MKSVILFFLLVAIVSLTGCEEKHDRQPTIGEAEGALEGRWILYEKGYSPGMGYIVEKVNTNPPSQLTLTWDKDFSSNISELTQFKFYRVATDSAVNKQILALYEEDPGNSIPDSNTVKHSYFIELNGNELKLSFRYCFEGCHLAFKRQILTD
jgi:hypothetical protein